MESLLAESYAVRDRCLNTTKSHKSQGEGVQNGLNQIYSQAVVRWTVLPMNGLTGVELGDNGLDWADSQMLSAYNAEMNSVISAFRDWKHDADPDAYYLFVVPKFSEGSVEGFMPRSRRFGFVTLNQLDARLVAHEVGHGAFNLRHTFPEAPQGSTDNLMDYPPAGGQAFSYTALLKAQWDLIHNPEATTGLFDEMEDGAMMIGGSLTLASIADYIDQIRQGNKDKKIELPMKITTGLGEYDKITLGSKDYSYIRMSTTGFNTLLDTEPTDGRPLYNMQPSELSQSTYTENGVKYAKYQFHELQTMQNDAPYADMEEATGTTRIEISVKENEATSFEEYLYPMDDIFLENVNWVSQFDENIFGLCSGCWTSSCCRRACEYMIGNTNIANCTDTDIASSAPYMAILGKIILASFSDNITEYTYTLYNSTTLNYESERINDAIKYLKDKLKEGRPIMIGVHETNIGQTSVKYKNANRATCHFMVIVGVGSDGENTYFRFYDPGLSNDNSEDATSPNNKLIYNVTKGCIQGIYRGKTYTISEIIKTN